MIPWKMIFTAIMTIVVVIGGFVSQVTHTGFFGRVKEKFSNLFDSFGISPSSPIMNRNISFRLQTDMYNDISVKSTGVNISIDSDNFTLRLSNQIETHRPVDIIGYEGILSIKDDLITLEGSFDRLDMSDVALTGESKLRESSARFNTVMVEGLELEKVTFQNSTGVLSAEVIDMDLKGEHGTILSPKGKFVFSDVFKVEGLANKITVYGDTDITISS